MNNLLNFKRPETQRETELKAECDEIRRKLEEKQKELDNYRNEQESGVLDSLRKIFAGKIIRVRQYEYGLSAAVRHERPFHYKWVRVKDVTHRYRDQTEFSGEILELNMQPNNYDIANHLGDQFFTKIEFAEVTSDQIRVDDGKKKKKFWTEEEIREVLKRAREASEELTEVFFKDEAESDT